MPATPRLVRLLVTLALCAATSAHAAQRSWMPEWVGTLGTTAAVDGTPDGGGLAFALAALWPLESRLRFGLEFSADDMGTTIGRLTDPNDGTDLGATALDHRRVMGAAWRFDVRAADARARWIPYARAAWGYYQRIDDRRGEDAGSAGTTGVSLGAGVLRPLAGRVALGLSGRYQRLFNEQVKSFVAVGVDWGWQ